MLKNAEEIKENIKKLVDKYNNLKDQDKIKGFNEAQTRNEFIEPLFEFLGWDMRNLNIEGEVITEEKNSNGRVDLAFRINGIPKFFLEAKSMKTDLDNDIYARQAINYSWNKGVTWAVLSDFEGIKIFNAQAESNKLRDKLVFEINYDEYISDFDRLWLLSKESFENNALDIYAEKHGKKSKKMTVNEKLFGDLRKARELLTKSFESWNRNVDKETLDEGIQKILDRLVFIRVLEDRELEQPILKPIIREWEKDKQQQLFHMLIEKFRELDEIYNSNLFTKHACEDWKEYDHATKKAIEMLYGNDMYEYDFKEIPADILGGVYESYLGYIAQNPILERGTKKGQLFALDSKGEIKIKARAKRKEHGIFYTPKFIVDYIVKNTLGEKLKEINNISDLKKIKVLDPACGSGSFLTRALEEINAKYKDFNNKGDQYTKTEILLSNIYGVDLDAQATEIAKLNLLIDALDKREKLPNLTKNIRVGNSLISGKEDELKKYFGKQWHDKKPFNWEENFSEVFQQGGFDVIIGNPPYGAELSNEEKIYYGETFSIGSTDTAILFVKRALSLLKEGGYLGFIIPKAFCFSSNYKKLREFIWDDIVTIVDCGKAWKEVKLEQVIVIIKKDRKIKSYKSGIAKNNGINIVTEIDKDISKSFGFLLNDVSEKEIIIAQKILQRSIFLREIAENNRGAILQKYISKSGDRDVIGGMQVQREGVSGIKGKIDSQKINDDKAFIKPNSILVQNIIAHIEKPTGHIKITAAVPENAELVIVDTINQITLKDKNFSSCFIKTILNSNFVNWYACRFILGKAIRTMHFDNAISDRIPIPKVSQKEQEGIILLEKNISNLNKQLQTIPKNSDKWNSVKEEIEKTDKLIDQKVYKLYGLTEEEIKIVENK